jgi:polysaccharide pyruvyl transferase WcaK-like protein
VGVYDFAGRGRGGAASTNAYREYLEKIGSFVIWLLERGYAVRVIIGDLSYDEGVLDDLRQWLRARGVGPLAAGLEDEIARSVEQVIEQIADCDIVVASRFHNVLLALLLARPVVSLSYNEKNDALMTEMGLGDFCQKIEDFRLDRLIEQLGEIERIAGDVRPLLLEKAASFRAALDRQYERLFAI